MSKVVVVGGGCKNIFQLFSFVIKTKLVQNVNRMSERQNDMPKDRLTDRTTDRQTERQIEDKTTFQPSYQQGSRKRWSTGAPLGVRSPPEESVLENLGVS